MNQNNQKVNQPEPKTESQKPGLAHKAGDAVERLGEKLQEKGFDKSGKKIEELGDRLEHSQDEKSGQTKH